MATVVPQGLAMICEAWPQIEYLFSLGRLKEDYIMSYAGKERHVSVETEQQSRPSSAAPTPFTPCCVVLPLQVQVGAVAVYRTIPPHCRWIAR